MTNFIALTGNVTADPEVRFTTNGHAVANLTVAHNPRVFDKESGEFKDAGEPLFLRGSVWRKKAEHVAENYGKGDTVQVTGQLKASTWTTKEGEKRTDIQLVIDEISLVRKASGKSSQQASSGQKSEAKPEPVAAGAAAGSTPADDDAPF